METRRIRRAASSRIRRAGGSRRERLATNRTDRTGSNQTMGGGPRTNRLAPSGKAGGDSPRGVARVQIRSEGTRNGRAGRTATDGSVPERRAISGRVAEAGEELPRQQTGIESERRWESRLSPASDPRAGDVQSQHPPDSIAGEASWKRIQHAREAEGSSADAQHGLTIESPQRTIAMARWRRKKVCLLMESPPTLNRISSSSAREFRGL